jgi:hypothetical protein
VNQETKRRFQQDRVRELAAAESHRQWRTGRGLALNPDSRLSRARASDPKVAPLSGVTSKAPSLGGRIVGCDPKGHVSENWAKSPHGALAI